MRAAASPRPPPAGRVPLLSVRRRAPGPRPSGQQVDEHEERQVEEDEEPQVQPVRLPRQRRRRHRRRVPLRLPLRLLPAPRRRRRRRHLVAPLREGPGAVPSAQAPAALPRAEPMGGERTSPPPRPRAATPEGWAGASRDGGW